MTWDELNDNLGTIAKSGSKQFVESLEQSSSTKDSIIGQFGVGFYSAFMVGDKIRVYTKSASLPHDSPGYCWTSDGLGSYTITPVDNVSVGTKVIIDLKQDALDFLKKEKLQALIQKHSNFIPFPILLESEAVNSTSAIWALQPSSLTDQQYLDFYRHIANNKWDEPLFRLHYKTDAPVNINALLFVPGFNEEAIKLEPMPAGVALYSKKVLIEPKAKRIFPDWLRFLKGNFNNNLQL